MGLPTCGKHAEKEPLANRVVCFFAVLGQNPVVHTGLRLSTQLMVIVNSSPSSPQVLGLQV